MNLLSLLLALAVSRAEPNGISARRAPNQSFRPYFQAARQLNPGAGSPFGKMTRSSAVTENAVAYGGAPALRSAPQWESVAAMTERFRRLRDARVLTDDARPEALRRATWLYPDDGCYARAALAVRTLMTTEPGVRPPGKIFLFGDLTARTANSPEGRVTWWYHVAPVVRVGSTTYVLDPAIEPARPLTADEWVGRQTKTPASTLVSICGSGSYVPADRCDLESDGGQFLATADEQDFLKPEWDRLVELGRDPHAELGDQPPWR